MHTAHIVYVNNNIIMYIDTSFQSLLTFQHAEFSNRSHKDKYKRIE